MIKIGKNKFWFIFNRAEQEAAHSIINIGWAYSLAKTRKNFSGFRNSMFVIQIISDSGRLKVGALRRVQLIEKAG